MKAFRPFFIIVAFLLMVGLACAFGGGGTATTQETPQAQPTTADDQPTSDNQDVAATDTPEEENSGGEAGGEQYFTDTFDGTLDNYSVENVNTKGDESKMDVNIKDGYLVFDLTGKNLWVYVTYNPFTYKDVKISVTADNRGKNNNNVTLFCRDNDEGWYEFSIANNGLYWIYAYDVNGLVAKGYNVIYNGGSNAIKQGKDVNVYTATCEGDTLSLSINDTEVKKIKDTKFKFREGKVGFGVSSFDVTPILVEADSFTVSEP
jgi:hypothetical protein